MGIAVSLGQHDVAHFVTAFSPYFHPEQAHCSLLDMSTSCTTSSFPTSEHFAEHEIGPFVLSLYVDYNICTSFASIMKRLTFLLGDLNHYLLLPGYSL